MFVYARLCLFTPGYVCLLPVMSVYARLCLFTSGYVRLFPVMSVRIMLRQTALHTFWLEIPAGSRQNQIKVLPSTNHAGCNMRMQPLPHLLHRA